MEVSSSSLDDDIGRSSSWEDDAETWDNSSDDNDSTHERSAAAPISSSKNKCLAKWDMFTERYWKRPLVKGLIWISGAAARSPGVTICISIMIAATCICAGFATNFVVKTERTELWTPTNSYSEKHWNWLISGESGFPTLPRFVDAIMHMTGDNVLTRNGMDCLFDVLEVMQNTTGYEKACSRGPNGECEVHSATAFFRHDRTEMQERLAQDSDENLALRRILSELEYPTGEPVFRDVVFGTSQPELPKNTSSASELELLMTSAKALMIRITEPEAELSNAGEYEFNVVNEIHRVNDGWKKHGSACFVSVNTRRSIDDEFQRGLKKDIPYIALAFIIMACFCSLYLSNFRRPVQSQGLVGVGAVVTILVSIATGYGLLFLIGVPFTSVTQVFPYVMVGIGLDDTFILTGAFQRSDSSKPFADRVVQVMEEVGVSITASTLTTVTAFFLGCTSSFAGVRWFSYYAAPTVLIDFIYQITFFIAILAYDDRRKKAGRYDCLVCVKAKTPPPQEQSDPKQKANCVTRLMAAYSRILLKPISKVVVIIAFTALLVFGILGALNQKQEFDFRKLVPADSYLRKHFAALDAYTVPETMAQYPVGVYFRGVDQSSEEVQQQMLDFVDELVALPYISDPPELFWLRDIKRLQQEVAFANYTFEEGIDLFLNIEPAKTLYSPHIVRDESGDIIASRTFVRFDKSSLYDVENQIDSLEAARKVIRSQPVNEGTGDWKFFAFGPLFTLWETYSVLVEELLFTVALGLLAVFVISLLFIPHPIGALLLTPVAAAIYVEILAVLYAAGVYLNGITSIGLIMSVGLVVDYNMHVVLTYYEIKDATTRNDRVYKCLTTMGTSILLGGFTTFIGVLPLLLTKSEIARTFFYTFLAIPVLGVAHGLMLVPVILSLVGPLGQSESSRLAYDGRKDDSHSCDTEISSSSLDTAESVQAYDFSSVDESVAISPSPPKGNNGAPQRRAFLYPGMVDQRSSTVSPRSSLDFSSSVSLSFQTERDGSVSVIPFPTSKEQ